MNASLTPFGPVAKRELLWAATWALSLAVLIAILHPHRETYEPGTAALTLLASSLVASWGGLRLAILASGASAMAFNYFFTKPYDSFRIESETSVVAFIVYLVLGIAMGVMVNSLRAGRQQSAQQAAEAVLVRDLTIDLVRQNVWLQPPLSSALKDLAKTVGLRGAAMSIAIPDGESFFIKLGETERLQAVAQQPADRAGDPKTNAPTLVSLRTDSGLRAYPVATGTHSFGMLAVETEGGLLTEANERVVALFANVVALACERAAFMGQAVERQALEATDRLRVTLMQSVTHDLRTPLTSITALAEALGDAGPLSDTQRSLQADIVTETSRLAKLVDQVLDLSRIEGGALQLRTQLLPVDDLLRAAVDSVVGRSRQVPLQIEPDLPPVEVDEPLVQQVVVNLLENAFRHGAPPVSVHARQRGAALEIAVVDHGSGIPEAERRRMFDPNFAMRRSTADERGHRLGLAISAGFIEAHRGHIRIEPTPGGGATFVISLPVRTSVSSEGSNK